MIGRLVVAAAALAGAVTPAASHRESSAESMVKALVCIHEHEGRWDDPDPPYYGGLQMDVTFQRTYGREFLRAFGTADHWTPGMQLAVAMRAVIANGGYGSWPAASVSCGLGAR